MPINGRTHFFPFLDTFRSRSKRKRVRLFHHKFVLAQFNQAERRRHEKCTYDKCTPPDDPSDDDYDDDLYIIVSGQCQVLTMMTRGVMMMMTLTLSSPHIILFPLRLLLPIHGVQVPSGPGGWSSEPGRVCETVWPGNFSLLSSFL